MVRRPANRTAGDPVWRRAIVAALRHTAATFPTDALAEHIAQVEAGAPVTVSDGQLLRGLHRLRATDLADLFRYDPNHGERHFLLDADDTLTEL